MAVPLPPGRLEMSKLTLSMRTIFSQRSDISGGFKLEGSDRFCDLCPDLHYENDVSFMSGRKKIGNSLPGNTTSGRLGPNTGQMSR